MLEIEAIGRRGRIIDTGSGRSVLESENLTSLISRKPTDIGHGYYGTCVESRRPKIIIFSL